MLRIKLLVWIALLTIQQFWYSKLVLTDQNRTSDGENAIDSMIIEDIFGEGSEEDYKEIEKYFIEMMLEEAEEEAEDESHLIPNDLIDELEELIQSGDESLCQSITGVKMRKMLNSKGLCLPRLSIQNTKQAEQLDIEDTKAQ